nr:fanconi-associated nuclease 1 homolog isoform X1 [Ipomoea batatas]
MLTGRESLTRLIGRRRRFLPNRNYILSSPAAQGFLSESKRGDGSESEQHQQQSGGNGNESGNSGTEWVNCPVCGARVLGDDHTINLHLDKCLARGTKRKLSQRTLLQLNFCSKVKYQANSSDCTETTSVQNRDHSSVCDTIPRLGDLDDLENHDQALCKLESSTPCNTAFESAKLDDFTRCIDESPSSDTDTLAGCTENQMNDDKINGNCSYPSLLSEHETCMHDMVESANGDDLSELSLDTYIVGRRFAEETELELGAGILLSRDPDNDKDPNAIKVLSTDSGYDQAIGFLPREIALYLSPLIEKFGLRFEGHITSVPKHPRAVVPIQITCPCNKSFDEIDCNNVQFLKSSWKNALCVAQYARAHPPGSAKYQHNLQVLLTEVLKNNHHLFMDAEKTLLENFLSLSDDSQRLFARLYTRKGPWFRMSNISYAEISDCDEALRGLSAGGYVTSFESMSEPTDVKEILNVLNVGELRDLLHMVNKQCAQTNRKSSKSFGHGTRKQDYIAFLLYSYKDGLCPDLLRLVLLKIGTCIQISPLAESLFWRAERLFFLNGEQDLSSFLLVDLGIVKYPAYDCILTNQIFPNRSQLLSYEMAIEVAQTMDECLDDNNTEMVLKCIEVSASQISSSLKEEELSSSGLMAAYLSCFTAVFVYSKVVLLGTSFLEHERRYNDAIILLRKLLDSFRNDRRRGYWTLRLSIDLEHVGCLDESLQVAEDGILDPWVRAGSKLALQRRVLRLGKPPRRWKTPSYSKSLKRKIAEVHVQGRPLNCKMGVKSIFYGEDGERCGVEQLALQYYAGEGGGWQGVHTESGIWLTLFGLLMWDVIFADIPNVFCTKFQTAPLDLETDSFYEVRKSQIEALLDKIQHGMAEEILITSWELHKGTACRGVSWDRHSLSELRAAVACIGGSCTASICRHLAQDYKSWSSGMPDLLLWRFHDNYRGEAKLVEVKGPRDRLSEQQRAWLLFLTDCGFNVEVCKVSEAAV